MRKRFRNDCVIPSERYWSTFYEEYCATKEETIVTLCTENDELWCFLQ